MRSHRCKVRHTGIFHRVTFTNPWLCCAAYNDPAFVKARNRPLGADSDVEGGRPLGTYSTGFEVALERDTDTDENGGGVANSRDHGIEAIGWAAFQHGKGSIGGDLYQASITESVVTHDPSTGGIALCAGFASPPLFFGNMATHHGSDSAEVRLSGAVTADSASVYVEEETCNDDETDHVPEVIAFFAFQRSSAHKIRARMQAPAAVPPVSEAVVCENKVTGPGSVCCGDMTNQACIDCWGRQGVAPPTGTTCTERATTTFATMNDVCCDKKAKCDTGAFPTSCSTPCAALWMPIWEQCGGVVESMYDAVMLCRCVALSFPLTWEASPLQVRSHSADGQHDRPVQ